MAFLTAILVTGLYTLVPAGRPRERGLRAEAVATRSIPLAHVAGLRLRRSRSTTGSSREAAARAAA